MFKMGSEQRPFYLVAMLKRASSHWKLTARHDEGGQWCSPHSLCQGEAEGGVPPKSVLSHWIRVVARGVGCAV